jgi:PilZ domain
MPKSPKPAGPVLPLLTPALREVRDRRGSETSMVRLFERIAKGEKERRSFRDRRATRRVAVALDLEAHTSTGEAFAQRTNDLSTFGLSIRSGPTPKKGSHVSLRLFLPDEPDQPLVLTAIVVSGFDEGGGMRVRFVDPPLEAVRRIHRLVK